MELELFKPFILLGTRAYGLACDDPRPRSAWSRRAARGLGHPRGGIREHPVMLNGHSR